MNRKFHRRFSLTSINQRISGPVNAHLTLVLVYILMLLYMHIAPGQRQTTHWGQTLTSTESPYHFAHFLQVLKQSLWSMILNTFWMILMKDITPGQGKTKPWEQNFDVNRNSFSLCPFVASFKKNSLKSDFLLFFFFLLLLFFLHVYSPRQGQTTHWGQKIYDNRKAFSLCPYVASFKMISSKSDFIHIFNDFTHIYSHMDIALGQGQKTPWGQTFDINRKPLSLRPFVASFEQIWILILYTFFNVFPHVYSPGAGADNPLWTKSWCQQKSLVTLPICCKFQKISLKSDFIHNFSCFYTRI